MSVKAKWVVLACVVLVLGSFTDSFVSFCDAAAQDKTTKTVTYDYFVVAGYETMPTPPSPASSPPDFIFTVDPPVFNFRNITWWGGRTYLYDGFSYSPYTNMNRFGGGARVNITNLLPFDITILSLTAEVTDGTMTEKFFFTPALQYFYNWTMVIVDTLDPGDYDECDYNTGMVEANRLVDGDRYNKIRSGIPPEQWDELATGYSNQGPGSLLEPDLNGDAAATGHVAPILLAAGATFTEYFSVIIFGDIEVGTEIDGMIQLSLTYEYEVPKGYPIPSLVYTPTDPVFNETVTFDATETVTFNDTTIQTYAWNFGDGTNATGMIVNHTYTTPKLYAVDLTVTDTWDRSTPLTKFVTISGPPRAMFTITPENVTITTGKTVTFNASASRIYSGNIVSYAWDFGDESTGSGEIVTHKYAEAGTYTVVLNVTNSRGLWDTESLSVTIDPAEPEFPLLWVGVGVVVVVVVLAGAVFLLKRKK